MNHILLIIFFLVSVSLFGQIKTKIEIEDEIINHFKNELWEDKTISKDSLYATSDFEGTRFNVSISDDWIDFEMNHFAIKNPYYDDRYDDSEYEEIQNRNYPKSHSVIYENHLVSLFENGKFSCYNLETLERNLSLENLLNTREFTSHWIIDQKLVSISNNETLIWNGQNWEKLPNEIPLRIRRMIYNDNDFVVFMDCNGEWGGRVYFFDRLTKKTYYTKSTCANTVIKTKEGYEVLAQLGHMIGFSELKVIPDPRELPIFRFNKKIKLQNKKSEKNFYKKIDITGIQIFSKFFNRGEELLIIHIEDLTVIAKLEDKEFKIVNQLFLSDLYTHNPITTQYGEKTLINLDYYGEGLDREVSVLIIDKNKITKLDWNK